MHNCAYVFQNFKFKIAIQKKCFMCILKWQSFILIKGKETF